jgi:hypothetical protein
MKKLLLLIVCLSNSALGVEIELGRQTIVISKAKHNIRHFPDEPIVVLNENPVRFLLVGDSKTYLWQGNSFESAHPVRIALFPGEHYDSQYAGITSVYKDPETGELLGFYHAEKPVNGDKKRFYSTVCLGVSLNSGDSFHKFGPIISGKPEDPNWVGVAQGNADPSICADSTGKWLYAYYTEHSRQDPSTKQPRSVVTCMARCKTEDLGRPGYWDKYYDGNFNEPGLGGKDTEVADCWAPNVTYLSEIEKYVMVGSRGGVVLFLSNDGIRWEDKNILFEMTDLPLKGEKVAMHPFLRVKAIAGGFEGYLFYAYSGKYDNQGTYLVKRPIKVKL